MPSPSNPSETEATEANEEDGSSVAMGGMAPTNAVTDQWSTASPKADATNPATLPKAVADAVDGRDHSADDDKPDSGGQVFDESVAQANRPSTE